MGSVLAVEKADPKIIPFHWDFKAINRFILSSFFYIDTYIHRALVE